MNSKHITLAAYGFPEVVIGYGIAPYGCPGEAFILLKLAEKKFRAFFQDKFEIRSRVKEIEATWHEELVLLADELKALPGYFEPETGKALGDVETKAVEHHPSISSGKIEEGPYAGVYKYDGYSVMPTVEGDDIHSAIWRTCLKVFFEIWTEKNFGIKLTCVNDEGELIQPVTADLAYTSRETEEDPYTVSVIGIDGEGGFEYSTDNVIFTAENTLTYASPVNAAAYIRDSAGTVTKYSLDATNWNVPVLL